jgi:preprotein translocase subunit SecE
MQAIKSNPYRTLGLLAGASTKEITRQANRLKKYITADAELPDDYSFAKIDNFQRTVEMIGDAVERNDTDPEKIENALFWFWKGNEITDEPTFDVLKEGDVENAFDIWFKLVNHKDENGKLFWTELTKKNFSAYHNIAVLTLTGRTDKWSFVNAVMANIKFIESEYFVEFVKSVTDETYKVTSKNIEILFLEKITNSIADKETKTTFSELVKYLNSYDFAAKSDFIKSISKSFADNIKAAITTCENARNANKAKAAAAGETLYKNTKDDLIQLKSIFGEQDFSYFNVADKVANETLQCSIDFFNTYQDTTSDVIEKAINLVNKAKSIAVGAVVKGRIEENGQTLTNILYQPIVVLKAIKAVYVQLEKENIMSLYNRKVVDETKVIETLKKELTDDAVCKIARSTDRQVIKEFYDLLKYFMSKMSQKSLLYDIERTFCSALPQSSNLKTTISAAIAERDRIEREKRENMKLEAKREREKQEEARKRREEWERKEKAKRNKNIITTTIVVVVVTALSFIFGGVEGLTVVGCIVGGIIGLIAFLFVVVYLKIIFMLVFMSAFGVIGLPFWLIGRLIHFCKNGSFDIILSWKDYWSGLIGDYVRALNINNW